MKKEQYDRAIQISNRLAALNKIKEEIKDTGKTRLAYTKEKYRHGNYEEICYLAMNHIGKLLDKHDKMIRTEIDAEIEELVKEIETL